MTPRPQPNHNDVVIVAAQRTPQGKLLGQLSQSSAVTLGSTAIKAALVSAGLSGADIDAVILGQVIQAGQGQNPARQSALQAGVSFATPAVTVNSVCLSGLRAVVDAARLIRLGEADIVIAGGQESMSQAPFALPGARRGHKYGAVSFIDTVEFDALTDALEQLSMGECTDLGNQQRGIDRASQDEIAVLSHQRAAQAMDAGIFEAEITPVVIKQRRGPDRVITQDEGIRPDSAKDNLAKLPPAFRKAGTITAGNSSPISDGAAAVVLTTRATAQARNLRILATISAAGEVAGPDTSLHSQPANAILQALQKAQWTTNDLDFIEINEAFGAVLVQSLRDLHYPLERTNIHGGAIALGHPVGASGARLVVHAAHELARRGTGRAAVALCGGGGQGEALLLWA
ncbi:acetyl-CoA C-acetyltransferase [Corynebacterium hindlerae]|uniref:acetyl-CoA C-acetyltransferase n=1 Tax=Corynebacterium hindlerae TaxID=699041 RepID=UPI003AAFBAEE